MALCSSVVFSVLCDVNEGQGRADEEEAESGSGADEAEGGRLCAGTTTDLHTALSARQ